MNSKNPLLKAQAALEFLMTYGWAILIVVIVVGALFALGLTSPCKWVGTQVREFADFRIDPSTIRFDTATDTLSFDMSRLKPDSVSLTAISVSGDATGSTVTSPTLPTTVTSTSARYTVSSLTNTKTAGDCYTVDVTLTYDVTTAAGAQSFTSAGKISGIAV